MQWAASPRGVTCVLPTAGTVGGLSSVAGSLYGGAVGNLDGGVAVSQATVSFSSVPC